MGDVTVPEWLEDGERIEAHYSSLTLHRKCSQAWYYRYQLGLKRPITGPAPELHFGSWWGLLRTAHRLERGRQLGSLIVPPRSFSPVDGGPRFDQKTLVVDDVWEAADAWWSNQDELAVEEWMTRLGDTLPNRLQALNTRWMDERTETLKSQQPLGVEVFWKRQLPRPDGDRAWENAGDLLTFEGLPEIWLIGFIDHIYRDTSRNMIVVEDDKTGKQLGTQTSLDDMMDSQLMLYAWGVTPMLKELGVEAPRAISYDRVKSSKPATPKLNLNGTLSKTVSVFDLRTYQEWARTNTRPPLEELAAIAEEKGLDETLTEMVMATPEGRIYGEIGTFVASGAKKGFPKWGVYTPDEELEKKLATPAWKAGFMQRTMTPISRHVIRAHLRAAVDTATDIWRTKRRVEITNEAARNLSKGNCTWCDFASLCRAQMVGGPEGDYDVREHGLRAAEGKNLLSAGAMIS